MMVAVLQLGMARMHADRVANDGPDDAVLVTRMAAGDGTALTAVYERHGAALLGYLLRLAGDRGDAEEILQDTLLGAWRSAARFEGRSSVRTWLFGIGRRQAYNRLRGRRVKWVDLSEATDVPSADPGPEAAALVRAEQAEIAAAMSRLRPLHTEVLGLAFINELSYAEIAAVLEVPVGTVKSRLSHAKAALAGLLAASREDRR